MTATTTVEQGIETFILDALGESKLELSVIPTPISLTLYPTARPVIREHSEIGDEYNELLEAVLAGKVRPRATGEELDRLMAALTHLAAHQKKAEGVADLLEAGGLRDDGTALRAMMDAWRPNERGECVCPVCAPAVS